MRVRARLSQAQAATCVRMRICRRRYAHVHGRACVRIAILYEQELRSPDPLTGYLTGHLAAAALLTGRGPACEPGRMLATDVDTALFLGQVGYNCHSTE